MGYVDLDFLIPLSLTASTLYVLRTLFVLVGLLKDPILRQFRIYSDDEPLYYPVPGLLAAAGVFALAIGVLVTPYLRLWFLPAGPGILVLWLAYLSYYHRGFIYRHADLLLVLPRWQRILREYTNREERRRIGYMWLRLSWRARLHYNSSDRAFLQWADLIVMASVLDV